MGNAEDAAERERQERAAEDAAALIKAQDDIREADKLARQQAEREGRNPR